jgi:hypothetical protein
MAGIDGGREDVNGVAAFRKMRNETGVRSALRAVRALAVHFW